MPLNKDGLEPGALVDDETHARLMRKHQREAAKPAAKPKTRKSRGVRDDIGTTDA